MCHMWHDGSATRPINREERKSHFVPLLLLLQYHPSSAVHTSVIPVFKAFTLNRLNIKRDLWQHISPLDVITGVNFAPSAWRDWFSLLWKVEETKHIFTLLSAGAALNTHDAFRDIFAPRGPPSKKSGQLFASVSRNDSMSPNVTLDAFQTSTSNCRCRRAMPQNCGKLGRGERRTNSWQCPIITVAAARMSKRNNPRIFRIEQRLAVELCHRYNNAFGRFRQ